MREDESRMRRTREYENKRRWMKEYRSRSMEREFMPGKARIGMSLRVRNDGVEVRWMR